MTSPVDARNVVLDPDALQTGSIVPEHYEGSCRFRKDTAFALQNGLVETENVVMLSCTTKNSKKLGDSVHLNPSGDGTFKFSLVGNGKTTNKCLLPDNADKKTIVLFARKEETSLSGSVFYSRLQSGRSIV